MLVTGRFLRTKPEIPKLQLVPFWLLNHSVQHYIHTFFNLLLLFCFLFSFLLPTEVATVMAQQVFRPKRHTEIELPRA